MANVDGRRFTDMESANVVKFKCDPCSNSGIVKDADKFCRQCDEYMCESCATIHKGFKVSRNHTAVPCSGLHSPGPRDVRRPSMTFCEDHPDKVIQWCCEKHDAMFCDNCKLISHRKCNVTSISGKANDGHGQLLDDAITSMSALKSRIGDLKNARGKSVEDLEKLEKSFVDEVELFKADIVEFVERLGRDILTEMKKVVSTERDVILNHVKTCNVLISKVETELRTADEAKISTHGVTSVIAAHKLFKTRKSLEPTVSDIEHEVYTVNVTFQPSRTLADVITDVDQLGTVNIDRISTTGVEPSMSAYRTVRLASTRKSFPDMDVESSADINIPAGVITGSTITPDGRIVLAHNGQQQVILLDINFTTQSSLALPGRPWDVAADGENDVIVSLGESMQLQWIRVDGALRAGRTVTTSHPCWGVAVHNGHIYVSVKTGRTGHVQVLNRDGSVIRRIGTADRGAGMLMCPYYITVGPSGSLYVANWTSVGRITCFTTAGDEIYDVKHNAMQRPRGMVADDAGNLLVCCYDDDVHLLAMDGSHDRAILSSADGVVAPYSMAYRRSDGTLIVTMGKNPYCRAYKLK